MNVSIGKVAACKVVSLTAETTADERKLLEKEMKIHGALKHRNVLEFIAAVVVEPKPQSKYYPGVYMLMEIAAGGDLFDKIGKLVCLTVPMGDSLIISSYALAPDVGVGEDVAHHYFIQLASGLVSDDPLLPQHFRTPPFVDCLTSASS